ncbi:deoxypodophyllotoxin synthase-like [Coffea arabica]|uniref:Deoxypodophyllotoxin synthase-like n=1 Tax=Coffea arabica TaxID=13443 RepID=A0A6P6W446_COFAR|nr:2-oxoglutarate-dependent dioxygenase AOP2-like [Coffea arabica]
MAASQSPCKLPIIDLKKDNLKPGTSSWTATCDSVRHALEEYGCFLVVQDHVSAQFEKEVFDVVRELFDLPTETKSQHNLDMFVGYVGQLPHAPLHESMEIPNATTIDGVQAFTDLMWPSGNKRFCESMLTYAKSVAEVEQTVDRVVFASYGTMDHLESHIESSTYILRPLKYTPPEMHNNVDVGADVHTDKGFITVLHQNQVNALKVQARNGEWIDVDFSPASFLVLAGDAYQAWSNDRIHPPRHQVIMKENKERYCIALFAYNYGMVNVPEILIDEKHPLAFKPFDNFDLLRCFLSRTTDMSSSTAKAYCGINA